MSVSRAAPALFALLALGACDPPPGIAAKREVIVGASPATAPALPFPKPDRPVARIVSDEWSDEATRDNVREAERVMGLLDVRPGMAVADIGAGKGYYTVRLAPRVGDEGRVFAQDIVPAYLEALRERVKRAGLGNVSLIQGMPDNPGLPDNSIDLALLVHMYHEIEQPFGLLWHLHASLKPHALVAIVDMDRPTGRHGTPPVLLRCEMKALGFTPVATHDLGEGAGYLAVFQASTPRPDPGDIKACSAPKRG